MLRLSLLTHMTKKLPTWIATMLVKASRDAPGASSCSPCAKSIPQLTSAGTSAVTIATSMKAALRGGDMVVQAAELPPGTSFSKPDSRSSVNRSKPRLAAHSTLEPHHALGAPDRAPEGAPHVCGDARVRT
jgi:hypothetical protein